MSSVLHVRYQMKFIPKLYLRLTYWYINSPKVILVSNVITERWQRSGLLSLSTGINISWNFRHPWQIHTGNIIWPNSVINFGSTNIVNINKWINNLFNNVWSFHKKWLSQIWHIIFFISWVHSIKPTELASNFKIMFVCILLVSPGSVPSLGFIFILTRRVPSNL